ncbi:hypothetical protein [Brevundimonas poindexterae]|uniref:hypothetical protein n=1 Tax=Brevundimonas poindexterae TaxID=74325 RepID=UPI001CFC5FC5|nr:hypothetical protein [Brevundimonas poindexterae]
MSDKPLSDRLQVKKGRTLAIVDAPAGLVAATGLEATAGASDADVVLSFVTDRAGLERYLSGIGGMTRPDSILWVAYPKLTSPLAGEVSRNLVHGMAPAHGLDTVAQVAVDADWSAMRLKRL